jgi:hypothetical protein
VASISPLVQPPASDSHGETNHNWPITCLCLLTKQVRVFGSVVVVAFQIAFRAEIYANDVFSFFKNHF